MTATPFLLVVITSPDSFPGETDYLEALLAGGLEKLHIRKPADRAHTLVDPQTLHLSESLLQRLAPRWSSRLVLHGGKDAVSLARQYGVPQVHGHWHRPWLENEKIALSASLHSWKEVEEVPPDALEYVFLSPLFGSISKPGYQAGKDLLRRPAGVAPCKLIGLGGIDADTIGQVIEHGWDGAALLGYLWQQPEKAVKRFMKLKEIIRHYGR